MLSMDLTLRVVISMFTPIGEFSLLSGVSGSKFSPRLNVQLLSWTRSFTHRSGMLLQVTTLGFV
jgi:hypothetical protein